MCITMGFKFRLYFIAITFAACSHEPLPVLGDIPPFELLDNFGQSFTEKNISGTIWVADLIFTTCSGPCPIMSTEMKSVHKIYLENFEGPLDLLLYFIRRDKIDIYDIPISKITKEYMITLDKMKKLNVTIAGDFIDMAATLMRIKAKILLPSQRNGSKESVEDPRTALVQQLLVYQQFKIAAEQLSNLAQQQNHYFHIQRQRGVFLHRRH